MAEEKKSKEGVNPDHNYHKGEDPKQKEDSKQKKDSKEKDSKEHKEKKSKEKKDKGSVVLPKIPKPAALGAPPRDDVDENSNTSMSYQSPLQSQAAFNPYHIQDNYQGGPWGYMPPPWYAMGPYPTGPMGMGGYPPEADEADRSMDNDSMVPDIDWSVVGDNDNQQEINEEANDESQDSDAENDEDSAEGGGNADLLAAFRERYADEDGEPVENGLAELMNAIWARGRDAANIKTCYTKYPRPKNVKVHKVDLNEEILGTLERPSKTKDMKLRAVQGGIARSVVPMTKIVQNAMDPEKTVNKQKVVDMAVDAVTMLAHANALINQIRRDTIKPKLISKFQPLCNRPPKGNSQFLFGDELVDRIKSTFQGSRLGRQGQRGGRGGSRGRYQPYPYYQAGGNRGRGWQGQQNSYFGRYESYSYAYVNRQFIHNELVQSQCDTEMENVNITNAEECDVTQCYEHDNQTYVYDCRPTQVQPGLAAVQRRWTVQGQAGQVRPEREENVGVSILQACKWPRFKAGRISECAHKWAKITSDWHILKDVRGFHINFQTVPQQDKPARELMYSKQERQFMRTEIQELLEKGVVTRAQHVEGEYISNVFLREKKDKGKFRMILNLKNLNPYIAKQKFKMDTLLSAITMVYQNCWFLSLDFTDAYYSVRIAPESRKFLRFKFDGELYEFTCLPNGLRPAPRLFTKLVKVPLATLRKDYGIHITAYLDDTLLVFETQDEAVEYGRIAADLFQDLGFMISIKKSVLTPTRQIEFLGVIINSEDMTVSLPTDKAIKIVQEVERLIDSETCSIREMASVLGKLQATSSANAFAALHTKELEKAKNLELKCHRGRFDDIMQVSEEIKRELRWWLAKTTTISAPILTADPEYTLYTDASLRGWGYYDPQVKDSGGGRWSEEESQLHINVLELKAVELALRIKCRDKVNLHVRIMSDNTTTVACIKKQGSVQSTNCNEVAQRIWKFMLERGNWVSAAHCPGVDNVEADRASREFKDDVEWSLNKEIFQRLCRRLRIKPSIDLFASRLNYKVKRYVAWQPDPEAEYIDAFTGFWGGEQVYIFPPFGILPKTMQKFRQDRAEGLVIVPFWPTKPWFTMWVEMLIDIPVLVRVTNDVLYLPYSSEAEHPMQNLQLLAGILSRDALKVKDFQRELSGRSRMLGDSQQTSSMRDTGNNGLYIVRKGRKIPLEIL
jgi:hypothetical protein